MVRFQSLAERAGWMRDAGPQWFGALGQGRTAARRRVGGGGAETARIARSLTIVNEAAGWHPKRTAVELPSPSLMVVTGVPPDIGSTLGVHRPACAAHSPAHCRVDPVEVEVVRRDHQPGRRVEPGTVSVISLLARSMTATLPSPSQVTYPSSPSWLTATPKASSSVTAFEPAAPGRRGVGQGPDGAVVRSAARARGRAARCVVTSKPGDVRLQQAREMGGRAPQLLGEFPVTRLPIKATPPALVKMPPPLTLAVFAVTLLPTSVSAPSV